MFLAFSYLTLAVPPFCSLTVLLLIVLYYLCSMYTKKNKENSVSRQLYQTQKSVKDKCSHIHVVIITYFKQASMQLPELIDYLPIMTRN